MRYKHIFVLIVLLSAGLSDLFSQQVTYDWRHVIQSNQYSALCCMAMDSSGNMYVGGRLDSTIAFVDTTVTNTWSTGFLAKFTSDGDMVWFKQFEHSESVYAICFDSENNLYISGSYYGKVRIDDTLLYTWDVDTTYFGMFLAKFDTDGNRLWAKTTAGTFYYESDYAKLKQMTIDKDDNLVVVSYTIKEYQYYDVTTPYTKTLDSAWVTTPYPHWVYYYARTNVLVKFNKDGQKLWIKDLGRHQQHYFAIAADYSNNILLTGYFWDDYPFVVDSLTLNASGGENIFIIKYNPNGHLLWAQRAGGVSNNNRGYDITTDINNNIFLTGKTSGNAVFGGAAYFLSSNSQIIVKYDSTGSVKWARCIGPINWYGNPYSAGLSINIYNNEVYVCGFFLDSLLFSFSSLISWDSPSALFLRYNSANGDLLDAAMDLVNDNTVYPIELINSNGIFFVAGNKAYYTTYWKWDIFFGRLQEPFLSGFEIVINKNHIECIMYPNPCQEILIIDFYDFSNRVINIYDISGNLKCANASNTDRNVINVRDYLPGLYFLQVQSSKGIFTKKFIKY